MTKVLEYNNKVGRRYEEICMEVNVEKTKLVRFKNIKNMKVIEKEGK